MEAAASRFSQYSTFSGAVHSAGPMAEAAERWLELQAPAVERSLDETEVAAGRWLDETEVAAGCWLDETETSRR